MDEGLGPKTEPNEMLTEEQRTESDCSFNQAYDSDEVADSPEQIEAENIANKKLEQLMANFRDFSVRFVNFSEYREILDSQTLPSGELFIFKSDHSQTQFNPFLRGYYPFEKNDLTATEYIRKASEHGWDKVAYSQTDWAESTETISKYQHLLSVLKESHQEAIEQKEKGESVRQKTLEIFREKVKDSHVPENAYIASISSQTYEDAIKYLEKQNMDGFDKSNVEEIVEMIDKNLGTDIPEGYLFWPELQDYLLQFKDQVANFDNIWPIVEVVVRCRMILETNDPIAEFVYKGDDSRDIFRLALRRMATTYKPRPEAAMKREGWDRPYHLALIVSNDAIDFPSIMDRWVSIPEGKRGQGQYLLGAVACLPDKELWRQMSILAERAGEFAHPILDSRGNVRYPASHEKKSDQPEETF